MKKNANVQDYLSVLSRRVYEGEVVFRIENSWYGIGEEGCRALIAIHEKSFFQEDYIFSLAPVYLKKDDISHILLICKTDEIAFKIPMDVFALLKLNKQAHNRPILSIQQTAGVYSIKTLDGLVNIEEYKYDLTSKSKSWVESHQENMFTLRHLLESKV